MTFLFTFSFLVYSATLMMYINSDVGLIVLNFIVFDLHTTCLDDNRCTFQCVGIL